MGAFGRMAWIGLVWLTAVTTLIAGVPQLDCRCPTGQVKSICLGSVSETSECCCGGTCCAQRIVPIGQAQEGACCGRHQSQPANGPSGAGYRAERTGCVKTLAQPESAALTQTKTAAGEELIPAPVLVPPAALVYPWPVSGQDRASWAVHAPAPPADLVTILQHLLI